MDWNTSIFENKLQDILVDAISMDIDSNGYPHVSYRAYHDLNYAKWDGVQWNIIINSINSIKILIKFTLFSYF